MFHTQFLMEESCVRWSKVLYSRAHPSRNDTTIDDRAVYTARQNCFLQIDCFSYFYNWDVLRDEWHFLVAPKTTVINAESSDTFFYIVLPAGNISFFFLFFWQPREVWGEGVRVGKKQKGDLRITKFKKLRQLKAPLFIKYILLNFARQ